MDQSRLPIATDAVAFSYADGETLFAAGDRTPRGFLVLSGRVWLYDMTGRMVFHAVAGDVIGELAALFGRAQDLTAVADGPVRASAVTRVEIERAVEADPESARLLGRQMLNALRLAPPVNSAMPVDAVAPDAWTSIRIRPDSDELLDQMSHEGVDVLFLPFNIGREAGHGERPSRTPIHLRLEDSKPYNMSRHHMAIEAGAHALMIRDVGSQLGSMVNGARIGIEEPANVANLRPGENVVWAGGLHTPFRFVVTVTV